MNFLELLKSKTFWTGLGTVGYGIYLCTSGNANEGVTTILTGLGMIFLRNSVGKLGGREK